MISFVQGLVFNTESILNISLHQFLVYPLLKKFLYLKISTLSPTLNSGDLGYVPISRIISINRFFPKRTMISIIVLVYKVIQISKRTSTIISCHFLKILAFNLFINLLAIIDLSSLCVEYIKISLLSNHFCKRLFYL